MTFANAVFTGTLVGAKTVQDESGKDFVKGLLIIEEGKPGVILEIYGKQINEFLSLQNNPIVVVGSARLAPDSKQTGLKNDLVVNVRQFAIADGSINFLSITGILGQNPEKKYVADGGKAISTFSLAVNTWPHKEASWFELTAWERDAETICKFCQKGHALSIPFATAKIEEWEKNGETFKKWKFTAGKIDLHSRKENEGTGGSHHQQRTVSQVINAIAEKHGDNLDELPF